MLETFSGLQVYIQKVTEERKNKQLVEAVYCEGSTMLVDSFPDRSNYAHARDHERCIAQFSRLRSDP